MASLHSPHSPTPPPATPLRTAAPLQVDYTLMFRSLAGEEALGRCVGAALPSHRALHLLVINIADWGGDARDRVVTSLRRCGGDGVRKRRVCGCVCLGRSVRALLVLFVGACFACAFVGACFACALATPCFFCVCARESVFLLCACATPVLFSVRALRRVSSACVRRRVSSVCVRDAVFLLCVCDAVFLLRVCDAVFLLCVCDAVFLLCACATPCFFCVCVRHQCFFLCVRDAVFLLCVCAMPCFFCVRARRRVSSVYVRDAVFLLCVCARDTSAILCACARVWARVCLRAPACAGSLSRAAGDARVVVLGTGADIVGTPLDRSGSTLTVDQRMEALVAMVQVGCVCPPCAVCAQSEGSTQGFARGEGCLPGSVCVQFQGCGLRGV